MRFSKQLQTLNNVIQDVKNWYFMIDGKTYRPPRYPDINFFMTDNDNLQVQARVELWTIGRIYKRLIIMGKKEKIEDMPEQRLITIFDALLSPKGQDATPPSCKPVVGMNSLMYIARYWPAGDYVKQLIEHRNFMSMPEFQKMSATLDKAFKTVGAKVPSYVKKEARIFVPRYLH